MNRQAVALLFIGFIGCASEADSAQPAVAPPAPCPTHVEAEFVTVHPIFDRIFDSMEHHGGQLSSLGDALGRDCTIVRLIERDGRMWTRAYGGEGAKNEDWYGWHQDVLAPIDGKVVKIRTNPTTNEPGIMGQGLASMIAIRAADDTHVILAHVTEPKVKEGDTVKRGQPIAVVGNNGQSRHPHIHIGAWRGERPLQIRFDLEAMGKLYASVPEEVLYGIESSN